MTDKKLTHIFSSPEEINKKAQEAIIEGIKSQFPIENANYAITVDKVHALPRQFDHTDEKEAVLKSRSLTYPIKGDLHLINKHTGKVVDSLTDFSLMDAFALSTKHALVYKGNNYSVANQLQLLPGIYTRHRENGELESHVNTGTGRSFSVMLDPQSGIFYAIINAAKSPIAPLLIDVFPENAGSITSYVPKEIWDRNVALYKSNDQRYLS